MTNRGTVGLKDRARALELKPGVDLTGSVPVAPTGRARFRYNDVAKQVEVSVDGGAYVAIGGGGGSPWLDDGAGNVRLVNTSNDVVIGAAAVAGTERVRIIGDVRVESQVQVTELTSVPGSGLDLELSADSGAINASVVGGTGFTVTDTGLAVDVFQSNATRTTVQTGSDASAFNVSDGTNDYINVNTVAASEAITLGNTIANPTVTVQGDDVRIQATGSIALADALQDYLNVDISVGTVSVGEPSPNDVRIEAYGDVLMQVPDDTALAWVVQDSAGNNYIVTDTTNGNEKIDLGNAVTNPDLNFLGSGSVNLGTGTLIADGGIDRSGPGPLNFAQTNATSVVFGQASNPVTGVITIPDNTATAWSIIDENGDSYMNVTTTDFGEFVGFGNNNTSPDYFFQGSNITMAVGANASGRVEAASFGPGPTVGFSRAMFVGTEAQATSITIGHGAASLTINSPLVTVPSGDLVVGAAATVGTEVLRVVGDARFEPATIMTVTGQMDVAGQLNISGGTQLVLTERVGDPGATANVGKLYTKDISTITELFYQDTSGNVVQITSNGSLVAGTAVQLTDNIADAYTINEGSNRYLKIDTLNGNELIQWGELASPLNIEWLHYIPLSNGNAFRILDENGFNYLTFQTGPSAGTIIMGSPSFSTSAASNIQMYAGSQAQAFQVLNHNTGRTSIRVDQAFNIITFGNVADNHEFRFDGDGAVSIGNNVGSTAFIEMRDRGGDPGAIASFGRLYCKTVTGVELSYQDAAGNVVVLTESGQIGAVASAAYTRNATVVEDRTLLASASATTTNNNNVLAALIGDLQAKGILG